MSQEKASFDRRDFLKAASAASVAMAATSAVAADEPAADKKMPQMQLGKYTLSRMVCGSNCFNAGSHLSNFVNQEMRTYYTPDQILATLRRCEAVGVSAWQAGVGNIDLYHRYRDAGGKIHFMAIESNEPESIKRLAEGGCIAVAHHGEATDRFFKDKKFDKVNDGLKRFRDSGMLVGVSTHMPEVIDEIESRDWDVDYYMTCVYQRHRNEEELRKLMGEVPLPVGEVYLKDDPARMYQRVQKTKRTCLAFKILAAGRLCDHRDLVEQAYRQAFTSIKKGDGVIVGIYDRYSDQVAEGAAFVRKFG